MTNSTVVIRTENFPASFFNGQIETEAYMAITVAGNPNNEEIERIFNETGADLMVL